PTFKDLLDMAMNQSRLYGAADPDVAARLVGLLQELTWCDRNGEYRTEILEHRERMCAAISAGEYSPAERQHLLDLAAAVGSTQTSG
ncbi:MAG TPA: DUF2254 domain-containing protein, partial [Arthrobacter sp.]|nr:DUF2254 domain-containing protein [Arthrobacter sp.]